MSDKSLSREQALKWVAEVFEHSSSLSEDTARADIPTWDSLGMLSLMARLDEDFEILLEQDEMDAMQSVADILRALERAGVLA